MNIALSYHFRLGDIVRSLPLAEALHNRGDRVVFECDECFHDIFKCVDYCSPVLSGTKYSDSWKRVDLQVYPQRMDEYRASRRTWADFVIKGAASELGLDLDFTLDPIPRLNVIDVSDQYPMLIPNEYDLLSPHGISGDTCTDIPFKASGRPVYTLARSDQETGPHVITAKHLHHLPWIIANANQFLTVNSSPSPIAAAVRDRYIHLISTIAQGQDDFVSSNQIRMTVRI